MSDAPITQTGTHTTVIGLGAHGNTIAVRTVPDTVGGKYGLGEQGDIAAAIAELRAMGAVRVRVQQATHYCTYCAYYARRWDGTRIPDSHIATGTYAQVLAHADAHPIGDPRDMVQPLPALADGQHSGPEPAVQRAT